MPQTAEPLMSISTPDGMTLPVDLETVRRALDQIRKATPMKPDDDFRRHNQTALQVTADELRQFIERMEQLAAEKAQIADHQNLVMAEAKALGYDTKVLRRIIALRKRHPDDIAEEEAVLDTYKAALGMV
jgi:uncharacterized protein (UPF0335 family)